MFPYLGNLINYLFGTAITLNIYTYTVLVMLAYLVAAYLLYLELQRKGREGVIPPDSHKQVLAIVLIAGAAAMLGLKIFHILDHWRDFLLDPKRMLLTFNGLSFYGGLIFGILAVTWYIRHRQIPLPHFYDTVAPALAIGYAVGRMGCQLAGDGCWGIVNHHAKPEWLGWLPEWAWGFRFPHNIYDEGIFMQGCVGNHCRILPFPVFPTSLYEAILGLLCFMALWYLRKKITTPGRLFAIFLIILGVMRFWIEFIRVNPKVYVSWLGWSQAQYISCLLAGTGVFLFWYFRRYFLRRLKQSGDSCTGKFS